MLCAPPVTCTLRVRTASSECIDLHSGDKDLVWDTDPVCIGLTRLAVRSARTGSPIMTVLLASVMVGLIGVGIAYGFGDWFGGPPPAAKVKDSAAASLRAIEASISAASRK